MGWILMKKRILIIIGVLFLLLLFSILGYKYYQWYRIKHAKIEVTLVNDLTVEFLEEKHVSDFIVSMNGTLIENEKIDTKSIGKKVVTFTFMNDDHIKVNYTFKVDVVDKVAPVIRLGSVYKVKKNADSSFIQDIFCGDNLDSHPTCTIEGDYNLGQVGDYPVTFVAKDESGNTTTKNFTLRVYEPAPSSSKPGTSTSKPQVVYQKFETLKKKYKTDKTEMGIDVSKWQGDIDFDALKKAGVEFIFIRVGTKTGTNGEYVVDPKFVQNIEGANRVGIKAGVYFYSYSNTSDEAKKDAAWVLEQIKPYKIDLPIAFDWEDWSDFNSYHMSFFGLTSMAEEFIKVIEKNGHKGMLYSSKYFLEEIWFPTEYPIWLAHYTSKTNYAGKYEYWQMCSDGSVDGIKGAVDVNVRYLQ
jgi:GH25 family lysozyme M1 (1,4-beta-N-acetylmuramidase)